MLAVVAIISALWFADNAEFIETVSDQRADGATWHYVGWQDHQTNLPAITVKTDRAEKVIWKLK